jgi:hypothetical protein
MLRAAAIFNIGSSAPVTAQPEVIAVQKSAPGKFAGTILINALAVTVALLARSRLQRTNPAIRGRVLRETLATASHAMLRALAERGREIHRERSCPH